MLDEYEEDDEPQFICPIPLSKMIEWLKEQNYEVIKPEDIGRERGRASFLIGQGDKLKECIREANRRYKLGHDSRDILADLLEKASRHLV